MAAGNSRHFLFPTTNIKTDFRCVTCIAFHGNGPSYRCPIQAIRGIRGNNMKQATMVKKIGDMLYKNGLMAIALGLYIGIYTANLDKFNI
jgi:hypothetical protein